MTDTLFDLSGRTALVTGAACGIGRRTAIVLAGLGAQVWVADIDDAGAKTAADEAGAGARALHLDVTSAADWDAALALLRARSGRLDVLVNNAGIMVYRRFLDTTLEEFRHQQVLNVESVFLGMKAALPLMIETAQAHGGSASIVNLSSIYGQVASAPFSAYAASKGAVRMLTKAVAAEFATRGVRVNSIHPGPIGGTNLAAKWEPLRDDGGPPIDPGAVAAAMIGRIPVGRFGEPLDVAGAIAFLACDASRYMTGAELTVDGGYTAT